MSKVKKFDRMKCSRTTSTNRSTFLNETNCFGHLANCRRNATPGLVIYLLLILLQSIPGNQIEPWGFVVRPFVWVCNCGAGPGAFSDRGCLLFQVGLATEDLPGWDCCGKFKIPFVGRNDND